MKTRDSELMKQIRKLTSQLHNQRIISKMYENAIINHKLLRSHEQKAVQVDIRGLPDQPSLATSMESQEDDKPLRKKLNTTHSMSGPSRHDLRHSTTTSLQPSTLAYSSFAPHPNAFTATVKMESIEPVYQSRETGTNGWHGVCTKAEPGAVGHNSNSHSPAVESFEVSMDRESPDDEVIEMLGDIDPATLQLIKANLSSSSCKPEKY